MADPTDSYAFQVGSLRPLPAFDHRGVLMPTKPIIDVSEWQKAINWDEAAPTIDGAIIRVAEWRLPSRDDSQVRRNVDHARGLGVRIGGYTRACPWAKSPRDEAKMFHERLWDLELLTSECFIPSIDIEPTGDARDSTVDWPAWVRDFFEHWSEISQGAEIRFYTSGSYYDKYYGGVLDLPLNVSLWVGHTNEFAPGKPPAEEWAGKTPWTFSGRTTMHQYSHKGSIPGIAGDVDLNCLMPYTTLEEVTL